MFQVAEPELTGPILVVDDDPMILRMVARVLRKRGLQVFIQHRAYGLLNRIADLRPALVLLDVEMPGLDGTTLTRLVRADRTLAGVRILLHSGLDEVELARKAAECGADGHLVKGPALVGLVATVMRWLRPSRG